MINAADILWSLRDKLPPMPWSLEALSAVVAENGYDKDDFCIAIEASPQNALRALFHAVSQDLLKVTQQPLWDDLKTTAKVKHLLMQRYQIFSDNDVLFRSIFQFLKQPAQLSLNLEIAYEALNEMWYAAGDTATDYNFYTKRALLGFVHSQGLRVWETNPHNTQALEQAVDRHLAQVGAIGKTIADIKTQLKPLKAVLKNVWRGA